MVTGVSGFLGAAMANVNTREKVTEKSGKTIRKHADGRKSRAIPSFAWPRDATVTVDHRSRYACIDERWMRGRTMIILTLISTVSIKGRLVFEQNNCL
jgi:hypothetical protein